MCGRKSSKSRSTAHSSHAINDILIQCTDIAELLIESRADVNAEAGEGWSSALCAAVHPSTENGRLVDFLLTHGASPNDGTTQWTILGTAALRGHTHTVNLLLQNGAEVNARSSTNNTALQRVSTVVQREYSSKMEANAVLVGLVFCLVPPYS
jgi:ankyrin repeat protein